jgi:hypothetical protein
MGIRAVEHCQSATSSLPEDLDPHRGTGGSRSKESSYLNTRNGFKSHDNNNDKMTGTHSFVGFFLVLFFFPFFGVAMPENR